MNIPENEVAFRKKVGTWGKSPVIEVGLRGGLNLIFCNKNGKFEAIASGPHRAVSRHLAKKRSSDEIVWTDLNKADHIELQYFEHLLPYYEAKTDAINERMRALGL